MSILKIDDFSPDYFKRKYTEMYLERPRKYPLGLPVRLGLRCKECSRGCTIDLRLPEESPSALVEQIAVVFSSLCAAVGKHQPPAEEHIGQRNPSSDASEE